MSLLSEFKELDKDKEVDVEDASTGKYLGLPKAIASWMGAWKPQSTFTDVLRASGIYFVCPREFVLNYWQPAESGSFDWTSQLMMGAGSYFHHYLQNNVLGPMGVLAGQWVQYKDGVAMHEQNGFHPDPDKALWEIQGQQPQTWHYREQNYFDEVTRIRGHVDGFVDIDRIQFLHENMKLFKKDPSKMIKELYVLPKSRRFLLEIKTSGARVFDRTNSSDDIAPYYKMQAECYQKLSDINKTVFWFLQRDTMTSKIFLYEYERRWWTEAKRKAKIIWRALRDETLPESGMACKLPTDARAKKCAFKEPCWKMFDVDASMFSAYVDAGKARAEREGRKLLDLSKMDFE